VTVVRRPVVAVTAASAIARYAANANALSPRPRRPPIGSVSFSLMDSRAYVPHCTGEGCRAVFKLVAGGRERPASEHYTSVERAPSATGRAPSASAPPGGPIRVRRTRSSTALRSAAWRADRRAGVLLQGWRLGRHWRSRVVCYASAPTRRSTTARRSGRAVNQSPPRYGAFGPSHDDDRERRSSIDGSLLEGRPRPNLVSPRAPWPVRIVQDPHSCVMLCER